MSRSMGPPFIDGGPTGTVATTASESVRSPATDPGPAIHGGQTTAVRQRCQELYDAVRQEAARYAGRRGGEPGFETEGFRLERASLASATAALSPVVGQSPAASLWARGQSHTPQEPGPLAQREAEGD